MMNLQIWFLVIVAIIVALIPIVYLILNQKRKCVEWLKFAVSEAEKLLGGGTGQLKLRQVYDWYCEKFPIISSIVSFRVFSKWVDKALDTMKGWLKSNLNVATYIGGASTDENNTEKQSKSL